MAYIYDDVDVMLKPKKICTFMISGYKPITQLAYFCHDCNPNMNETYCEFCIETCHRDHHISNSKKLLTFCYCGKKLHHVANAMESTMSNVKECTFYEFDEITKNYYTYQCKERECKDKKICSWCVNFCHYTHNKSMVKLEVMNLKDVKCNCDNKCHKDDRFLFFYLKDFCQFRMEHLFNTHMINLLLEAPGTSNRVFGNYNIKMKNFSSMLEQGNFVFDPTVGNSNTPFSRAVMTLYLAVKNVKLYYFSTTSKDELIPIRSIIELVLNNSYEEKYDVRVLKKNLLFLLYKIQLCNDFNTYNKYHAKDYSNTTTIQRLELYNSVRNDRKIKEKYFDDNYNFRMATISLLEKYANICKVDDHVSMALFSTTIYIVKLLMHYGCYNIAQIKMINDIIETLLRTLKLEKTPKNNEEYKEAIFRKLPSLLYIMIYTYNDYVFLENLMYKYVNMKEFSIGNSLFGSKLLSSIFLSNVKYLLRYLDSKKFAKIIKLTFKSLSILGSENDYYLSNLFKIDRTDLFDFVIYYDLLANPLFNNNFLFTNKKEELLSVGQRYEKKFSFPPKNSYMAEFLEFLNNEKQEIEAIYLEYFTFHVRGIHDVLREVMIIVEKFFDKVKTAQPVEKDFNNQSPFVDMISILQQSEKKHYSIKLDEFRADFSISDVQLAINKSNFQFSLIKILKICHTYNGLTEDIFIIFMGFFEFYVKDNVANHINILQSCYLNYFLLFYNKYPHIILKFIYMSLKYLHSKNVILCDYSYIFDILKVCFNAKYSKLDDAEKYIQSFILNIKTLILIKQQATPQILEQMSDRIRNFLERLIATDSGYKEYFWIINFKRKLMLKEGEYINYINYDQKQTGKVNQKEKEDNISKKKASVNASKKRNLREIKKTKVAKLNSKVPQSKTEKIDKRSVNITNDGERRNLDETLNIHQQVVQINDSLQEIDVKVDKNENDMLINNESFINNNDISELTINQDDIVKKVVRIDEIKKEEIRVVQFDDNHSIKNNQIIVLEEEENKDNHFMLENVKNIEGLILDNKLPQINENNFDDQSMIKLEDNLHQQMTIDIANQGILNNTNNRTVDESFLRDDMTGHDISGIFDENLPFSQNNNMRNENIIRVGEYNSINNVNNDNMKKYEELERDDFLNNVNLYDEDMQQENEIYEELNNISPELFEIKKMKNKEKVKNRKELLRIKRIKALEKKQELLDKIMNSKLTSKAFFLFMSFVNSFSEDIITDEFQKTIKSFFSRGELKEILEQKRNLQDLKLRSQVIKLLRINYIHTPMSKNKSYFDLFYLNEYDFFIKLYERTSTKNVNRIASILMFELVNLLDIVKPCFEPANVDNPKTKKNLRIYLVEGLLSSIKIFADKVYSHGLNMTGEELCISYKLTWHFVNVKPYIDGMLQDKTIEEISEEIAANPDKDEQQHELEAQFEESLGGIDNFNRKVIFKVLFKNLISSIELSSPFYKKKVGDIWYSLNRRLNHVTNFDGMNYVPDLLEKNDANKYLPEQVFLINEFSRVCVFYMTQSKNFKQSPLLSVFNCMVHENDFNYRDYFFRLFLLSYTNDNFRNSEDNYLMEIINKSLEFDYAKLHPIIYKHFKEKSNEAFFNEINKTMLYNIIILFLYINRHDSYFIWDNSNYKCYQIIKFYSLLAKNPTTDLHSYILKYSHQLGTLNYNFFILIEALLNKIIRLSKWGRDYDLKNEVFYDNLFIVYHQIVSCISDYARESDTEGVITIYARLKSYIFGLKKIMFYESLDPNDIIYEIKLSIVLMLISLLEEDKGSSIVSDLVFYFDPYKMFKICVFHFKLLIKKLIKKPNSNLTILYREDPNDLVFDENFHVRQFQDLYQSDEEFSESILLNLCNRIYFYITILARVYKHPNAIKCIYAIKRYKMKINGGKKKTLTDYKYFNDAKTQVDAFLESDEVTQTEYCIYKFLKSGICMIEVYTYRNKLEYVFFPRINITYFLHAESISRFEEENFERDMSIKKLENLNHFIYQALEETYYIYHLNNHHKIYGILFKVSNFFYYKFVIFSINSFIAILNWAYLDKSTDLLEILLTAFNAINFAYMIIILTIWILLRYYPSYRRSRQKWLRENKLQYDNNISFITLMRLFWFDCLIKDKDFLYLILNIVFALASMIANSNFCRFLQMFTFCVMNSTLLRTIYFIGKHTKFIISMSVFFVIFVLTYASFVHDFYGDLKLQTSDPNSTDLLCSNFSTCLFAIFFYGVRYDEGLTSYIAKSYFLNGNPNGDQWRRFVLEFVFHVFAKGILLILLIAVFILVYFDLKNSHDMLENDSMYVCYICHLNRDLFLKYKLNFDHHVKNEHNFLYYVYFIMYIITKDPQSLTKTEAYCLDNFRIHDFRWFPSQDTQIFQHSVNEIKNKNSCISNQYYC